MAITIVVGVASGLFGIVVGFLTVLRNRDKDVRSDATESAVIRTKLDTIGSGVGSIQLDLRMLESNTRKELTHLSERLIRNEESTKQAHKRIDSAAERGVAQ